MSSRQSRTSKTSSRDFSQTEVKTKSQKQTKPLKQLNNSLFSSSAKKPREEKKEFVFEEPTEASKGSKTPRSVSRSREPVRQTSLTPKGLRSQEKKVSIVRQQTSQQQKPEKANDKSQASTPKKQVKEFFPESSKRLQDLDSSSNTEAKFK